MGTCARVRLALLDGAIDEGLALLDEVGARLMAGEVDPLMTGNMYCELVCAAQNLGRHDLAREWTDVMDTWRRGRAFGGVNGRCRVHRAELLRLSGPASAAEDEALAACAELTDGRWSSSAPSACSAVTWTGPRRPSWQRRTSRGRRSPASLCCCWRAATSTARSR